jgi:hypothetical protein
VKSHERLSTFPVDDSATIHDSTKGTPSLEDVDSPLEVCSMTHERS